MIPSEISEKSARVFETRGIAADRSFIVQNIKDRAACLLDAFDDIKTESSGAERLVDLARTDLESAVMWAVKAVSRE